MIEKNSLTGIKDLDREIVNKLSDKDFLQMCSINRTYAERVCDDSYFRLRTLGRFPETVPYKDYINENEVKDRKGRTRKVRTWKNHYLIIVKYIHLLQTDYKYSYKPQDKSPELLYLAGKLLPRDLSYSKNRALIYASQNGYFPIVKYLVENGADITTQSNAPVIFASGKGHLSVVKYLVEHGADVTTNDNEAVRWASEFGHSAIAAYLVEHGSDITARDNEALIMAKRYKHKNVVEYIRSLQ